MFLEDGHHKERRRERPALSAAPVYAMGLLGLALSVWAISSRAAGAYLSRCTFAWREREIHLRFFGSKKAPVAISPRFLNVSSHFLSFFIAVCRGHPRLPR
jgi:hypothetical protein